MSSHISCIVIKSDRVSRKVPITGEVVGVVGREKLFVVMHVDHEQQMAQLMERYGEHHLTDVPLSSLRTFNRNVGYAIRRFLDAVQNTEEGAGPGTRGPVFQAAPVEKPSVHWHRQHREL